MSLEPHPSLPARPAAAPRQPAFAGMTPRSVRASAMPMSAAPAYPAATPQVPYQAGGYQPNYPVSNGYYQQQQPAYGTSTPPVMSNPYPAPAAFGRFGHYDPEEEQRIAEWNAAYAPKEDANKRPQGVNAHASALTSRDGSTGTGHEAGGGDGSKANKQKTVVRSGGGKTWEDPTLLEWDPLHPRLFVGNLAGEVTDDSLYKAFAKYPSVSKARVIRDKKTTKSKSYGFVSFSNTDDYFRAAKEMEGKYIGSHPVRIKRANTEVVASTKRDDKHGKHGKKNNKDKNQPGNSTVIAAGPAYYSGIQKSSQKNKGGPRLLG